MKRYENQNHQMHRQDGHGAVPVHRYISPAEERDCIRKYPCSHPVGWRNHFVGIPCHTSLFQGSRMAGRIRNFIVTVKAKNT
jgi:hypothetical protein